MRLRVWLARVVGVLTARRRDARLEEEMPTHLDALVAAHEARGLPPTEARLAAPARLRRRRSHASKPHRAQAGLPWLDAVVARCRALALRRLAPSRGSPPRSSPHWPSASAVRWRLSALVTAISRATPPFRDPGDGHGHRHYRRARADAPIVSWPDYQTGATRRGPSTDLAAFAGASVTLGR